MKWSDVFGGDADSNEGQAGSGEDNCADFSPDVLAQKLKQAYGEAETEESADV